MVITFPHMGNIYLAGKVLLDALDLEYIIPPLSNKKALEIGVKISPEDMCLPFKIMMGNYIQSIEKGADTIILISSCGPCRFGQYAELQIRLLRKAGYNVKFVLADVPNNLVPDDHILDIRHLFEMIPYSKGEIVSRLYSTIKAMSLLDKLEGTAHKKAAYELNKGESKRLLQDSCRKVYNATSYIEAISILKSANKHMAEIIIDKSAAPLKVAIIGDIYTIIDPFSNMSIEEKLMDYGVYTTRQLSPSWWIKNSLLKLLKLNNLDLKYYAKDYLPISIGGYSRECIGEAVMAVSQKYDGAIQIFPSGCMPEIVAKSILPSISRDKNFPILSLVMDEMSGEAGYNTRIEAYIDLLERRNSQCTILV